MSILAIGIGSSATAYRDGKILVVPLGASLPRMCVQCGEPSSGEPLTKTFRWHSPWLYLLIFPGLLLYVIAALAVQERASIDVPFCTSHRSWRTRMNLAGAVLLIGFLPTCFLLAAFKVNGGVIALVAIAMVFAGLIVLGIVGSSFTPVYIDASCAKFKGAGEKFLSSLPSGPV